jgi:hypothetical protein
MTRYGRWLSVAIGKRRLELASRRSAARDPEEPLKLTQHKWLLMVIQLPPESSEVFEVPDQTRRGLRPLLVTVT